MDVQSIAYPFFFGVKFDGSLASNLNLNLMYIKELLLNGQSFLTLLKEFAIEAKDIIIQDEDVILADRNLAHREIVKETICIEGKNASGIFNFFGTLHYNLLNQLAVFEMQGFEEVKLRAD
jgi:hypothetical protein